MAGSLQSVALGPFTRVVDTANPSLPHQGAAKRLQHLRLVGASQLVIRDGTRVVLTLYDDAETPAEITSVIAIAPFADGCLIVGHSTATDAAYLYRLNATLTEWTDSDGVTHENATPEPIGALWTSIPEPPEVTIAEGLGCAYIAHAAAADATALAFPLKVYDDTDWSIATVTSDLDGDTNAEDLYPTGVVSFQQHLWMWGVGSGDAASEAYRPEMARFSQPNFDAGTGDLFRGADSITLGHRVRSRREGIVGGFVAGEALFLGAPYLITRVTGFGRNSWVRDPIENSYGFVNQKCGVAVGGVLYYWSPRGPMRVDASGASEGLFDPIAAFVAQVVNPQTVIAAFDADTDMVIFTADIGSGVRTWCGYDVRRNVWVGPDNDWGLAVRCVGTVNPIYLPTAAVSLGPTGSPTASTTDSIGGSTARGVWTNGDPTSPTRVEIRRQGTTSWTVHTVSAGLTSYTFTGLSTLTAYEWRIAHAKDGSISSYSGPSATTQFTTLGTDAGLAPPSNLSLFFSTGTSESDPTNILTYYWTNSGESGVYTDVELSTDDVTYVLQQQVASGVSSANVTITASGTYYGRVRHGKSGSAPSAYAGPVTISITIA